MIETRDTTTHAGAQSERRASGPVGTLLELIRRPGLRNPCGQNSDS
jgi:hypothetical protein